MASYRLKQVLFDAVSFAYLFTSVWIIVTLLSQGSSWDEDWALVNGAEFVKVGAFSLLGSILALNLPYLNQLASLGPIIFAPPKPQNLKWVCFWKWQLALLLGITLLIGVQQTQFSFRELTDETGFAGAIRLFQGLLDPNLSLLPMAIIKIIETIFIAFMATFIAIPISFVLGFVCAKNILPEPWGFGIYALLRTLLNITRSVEPLIWAIIFSVWVGIGPFAGMLALMIHSVASLTKQYSEIVESISSGPIEGIQSTGASFLQVIWFAMVPQVVLPFIAFTIYRWDINVRMATVIGLVGGGGIGTMLIKYQGQAMWPEVGCIILVIAAVVWIMDMASAYLREAIK